MQPTVRFAEALTYASQLHAEQRRKSSDIPYIAHLLAVTALVLEHGANQAADVAFALVAAGFARVRCHFDLAGRERVTEAQWP